MHLYYLREYTNLSKPQSLLSCGFTLPPTDHTVSKDVLFHAAVMRLQHDAMADTTCFTVTTSPHCRQPVAGTLTSLTL